jgi:hypothetical protein
MSAKNHVSKLSCGTSLREQVDAACDVYRHSEAAKQERAEILRKTHGYMSQADGECFEQAVANSRRMEDRG